MMEERISYMSRKERKPLEVCVPNRVNSFWFSVFQNRVDALSVAHVYIPNRCSTSAGIHQKYSLTFPFPYGILHA